MPTDVESIPANRRNANIACKILATVESSRLIPEEMSKRTFSYIRKCDAAFEVYVIASSSVVDVVDVVVFCVKIDRARFRRVHTRRCGTSNVSCASSADDVSTAK